MSLRSLRALYLVATLWFVTESFAANKFEHAEYFKAASNGQKATGPSVKGALCFDTANHKLEFLDEKSMAAFSIKYDAIKDILYEQTSKPRYAEAVLISPFFLLSHSKKHYLTVQYTDGAGTGAFVIVRLDKKNAQEAVVAAEAETGRTVERVEEK